MDITEYMNTPSPYDQTETREEWKAGWYDFAEGFNSLEAQTDNNGLLFVKATADVTAPVSHKGRRRFDNLYVGTHADKMAELPETRKKSPGDRLLVACAKVNGVSVTIQTPAAFHASLLGKPFTARLELDRTGKYINLTRIVPLGSIPARIDGEPLSNGDASKAAPTNGGAIAGAAFGNE